MIISLVAGLALAYGITGHWFVSIVGMALAFRAIDHDSWRRRWVRMTLVAFVVFVVSLSWTRQFTLAGWPVLSAFQAVIIGVAAAFVPSRKTNLRVRCLLFPAALVVAECFRVRWPLGGFPMAAFGSGQADGPLAMTAPLTGALGVMTALALAGVSLSELLCIKRRHRRHGWALLLGVVALVAGGHFVHPRTTGTMRIAAVQAGGKQAVPPSQQQPARVFLDHYSLSGSVTGPVDLILWPEDVVEVHGSIHNSPYSDAMGQLARAHNASVAAGVVETNPSSFNNALVVWNAEGNITGRYDKVRRVPFGEYIPARSLVEKLGNVSAVPHDAVAGTGSRVVGVNDHVAGVLISYEGLFSNLGREAVRQGAEVILIPTNASSYSSPKVARMQIDAARLRALENGRWVVQSAPTGKSAIIDARGRVRAISEIGPSSVLRSEVGLSHYTTPFTRFGDWPLFVSSAAALLVVWLRKAQQRRLGKTPQSSSRAQES